MATLESLYQDLILDHNRRPRNYGALENANHQAAGNNPLCGDRLTVWLRVDGEKIEEISFEGSGCAITRASASLMTTLVKGKTRQEAEALLDRFHRLVTGLLPAEEVQALGKLAAFQGVSQFPVRIKCATLSWHALKAALSDVRKPVTTE